MKNRVPYTICDKFNYVWVVSGFLFSIILFSLMILFYQRDGSIKIFDGLVITAFALYPLFTALLVKYKIRISYNGIQPISILKKEFIKWAEIDEITWKVGINYTKHGVNVGTYNVVKFLISKPSPKKQKTVSYKIWNEQVSKEMENLCRTLEQEKGIKVQFIN